MSSSQVVNTSERESNEWAQTPWRKLEKYVFQLQKRIYRARQRGDWKTVRGLQRLLRRSRAARTLAVRRVTQDNSGKNTPGIDGVAKLSPKERLEMVQTMNLSDKAQPVRRVWIPKPGKTEMRPLGIPMYPAYCISCARVLGIVIAEPVCLRQPHWAQNASLITVTSEVPDCCCLTADELCLLSPHSAYSATWGPRC